MGKPNMFYLFDTLCLFICNVLELYLFTHTVCFINILLATPLVVSCGTLGKIDLPSIFNFSFKKKEKIIWAIFLCR